MSKKWTERLKQLQVKIKAQKAKEERLKKICDEARAAQGDYISDLSFLRDELPSIRREALSVLDLDDTVPFNN